MVARVLDWLLGRDPVTRLEALRGLIAKAEQEP